MIVTQDKYIYPRYVIKIKADKQNYTKQKTRIKSGQSPTLVINIFGILLGLSQSMWNILRQLKTFEPRTIYQILSIPLIIGLIQLINLFVLFLQSRSQSPGTGRFTLNKSIYFYLLLQIVFYFNQSSQQQFPKNQIYGQSIPGYNNYNLLISLLLIISWVLNFASYLLFFIWSINRRVQQKIHQNHNYY